MEHDCVSEIDHAHTVMHPFSHVDGDLYATGGFYH